MSPFANTSFSWSKLTVSPAGIGNAFTIIVFAAGELELPPLGTAYRYKFVWPVVGLAGSNNAVSVSPASMNFLTYQKLLIHSMNIPSAGSTAWPAASRLDEGIM